MTGINIPSAIRGDDQLRTARMLPLVLWPIMISATLLLSVVIYVLPENTPRMVGWIVSVNALGLLSMRLAKRGHARRGGQLFVGGFWALILLFAWTGGGLRASGVNVFPLLVLVAGLLLGARAGIFTAALCILSGLFLLFAELRGILPPSLVHHNAVSLWVMSVLSLVIVVALQFLAARTVQSALQRSQDELAERRRVESELRLSEQKSRAIVEDQSEMIVRWQPDGIRTFVNGAYCRTFGGRYEDFVGSSFYPLVVEEEREMIRRNTASLTPANPVVREVHRSILPSGEICWQEWSDRAIFDEKGALLEIQSVGRDVTERKRFEERLERSSEQLRALSSRLQTLREDERTHISREIHDQLGQLLTALKLDLHSLKRIIPGIQEADRREGLVRKTDSAIQLADDAIASVQKIATELRPIVLDRLGLAAAIEGEAQSFQSRTGIPCETILPVDTITVPREQSTAVFRIFQEILTNVIRHAKASHVEIRLDKDDESLLLEVSDDGVGIRENDLAKPTSLGVLGMQERAKILGGNVTFARNPDTGTTVTVRVPLTERAGQEP